MTHENPKKDDAPESWPLIDRFNEVGEVVCWMLFALITAIGILAWLLT
jgi:hypothetical protein